MRRKLDITDKLSFEENPVLIIKGVEIEINADTATMFRIMEIAKNGGLTGDNVLNVYDLLFSEDDMEKIKSLKLSPADFAKVVNYAMDLVTGAVDDAGEAVIPATT